MIFLNVKIHTTDLVNKRKSYQTKRNINVYHIGTFKKNLCNFGYIWRITLYSSFKYQNEKKQISNFNQIWKLTVSEWFEFKTYFLMMEIQEKCLRYVQGRWTGLNSGGALRRGGDFRGIWVLWVPLCTSKIPGEGRKAGVHVPLCHEKE